MDEFSKRKHTVVMENRESIELSGVKDVPSFNEMEAVVYTDYGDIVLKGSSMRLDALDLDSGNVKIYGKITAIIYNDKAQVKGFFKRVLSS